MSHFGTRIGIVGGGQLGKMMILEAKKMGFYVVVLDPSLDCPCSSICDEQIVKDFTDPQGYLQLSNKVDVITYEFEHINSQILSDLQSKGHKVFPSPDSLKLIQNKRTQKEILVNNGIPTPKFLPVSSLEDIKAAGLKFKFPMMLKATTGGYDGKGNSLIKTENDIVKSFNELGAGKIELIVEEFCPFVKEVSVLSCRDINGNISVYPVAENIHKESILDETIVPADISKGSYKKAMDMAYNVMEVFSDVGMFCTEMFVTENGEVLLNEVAPRPHNSGHYTIEGCYTSQYEAHIRAITGLPIGSVDLIKPIVMRNILGTEHDGVAKVVGEFLAMSDPMVKVHIYGKKFSKLKRKMGHLTAIGETAQEARKRAENAFNNIKIIGE